MIKLDKHTISCIDVTNVGAVPKKDLTTTLNLEITGAEFIRKNKVSAIKD